MIAIDQDDFHIFIHIHTQYYGHEYRVMAPLEDKEARELVDALQTILQARFNARNRSGKLGSNDTCTCIPNMPVMAGCPRHDAGPYPGPITDSGLGVACVPTKK
jgi:hypothetical protein